MTWSAHEREAGLAIEALAPAAEAIGPGWRFRLGRQAAVPSIAADVEGGWLLLDAPLENAVLPYQSLVEANARLWGGAKFALVPEDEAVHVRAELPLGVEADLANRLPEAVRGFREAAALAGSGRQPGNGSSRSRARRPRGSSAAPAAEADLDRLCEEAGWVFTRRSSGCLAVDLEGTAQFCQAQLERRADGDVALSVVLDDCHSESVCCGQATAIFLLRYCGWLRMTRGVVQKASERVTPRFEVVLAADPSPSELSEALAALSVAVRLGAEEVHVLARSEELARCYLAYQPQGAAGAPPAPKRARRSSAGPEKGRTKKRTTAQHRARGATRTAETV